MWQLLAKAVFNLERGLISRNRIDDSFAYVLVLVLILAINQLNAQNILL